MLIRDDNRLSVAGGGTARVEDAQGIPNQGHASPSILAYEGKLYRTTRSSARIDTKCVGGVQPEDQINQGPVDRWCRV